MISSDSQASTESGNAPRSSDRRDTSKTNNESAAHDLEGEVEILARVADLWADESSDTYQPVFQAVIQHMQEAVLLIDREFKVRAINESALNRLGMPQYEIGFALTPESFNKAMEAIVCGAPAFEETAMVRCLHGECIKDERWDFAFKDGSKQHLLVSGAPIYGPNGSIEMALVVLRDVTKILEFQAQTRKLLAQVRRQRASLQQILNHMPAGVIMFDSEFRVLAANRTYSEYFAEWLPFRDGARIDEVLPRAEESGVMELLRRALETNTPVAVRNFRYDGFNRGSTYWSGSAVPVELHYDGNLVKGIALVAIDVTDEVLAQSRLAELAALAERRAAEIEAQHARLNTILEAAPVPLFVFDTNGGVVSYNSAAMKMAESVGLAEWLKNSGNLNDMQGVCLLHTDGAPMDPGDTSLSLSLAGETCKNFIMGWRMADGFTKVFSINSAPLRGARGQITGVVQAMTDVTEQMRIEEEKHRNYQREHAVADKLQRCFLPDEFPETKGFAIAASYNPALDEEIVGGDFYDVFPLGGGKFGIVIGDVAGKGLKSAIYTAMTKYMLKAYALEDGAPETVLSRLNNSLVLCTPCEVFITLVYGVLDVEERLFIYANAGHEHPMFYTASSCSATQLDVTGRALALLEDGIYKTRTIKLKDGDILLLYTDGLIDAGQGLNRLGHDNVLRVLESNAHRPVCELVDSLKNAALDYAGDKLADDAAMLVVKAQYGGIMR